MGGVGREQLWKPTLKARLLAVVRAWRDDWRGTRESTKVIVVFLAAMVLTWFGFVIWFWIGFDF